MELIIDANVLISALISPEGKTREIIFAYDIKFYAPEFLFTEIEEHKEEILKKSRLSDDEFDLALNLLKSRIILVPFTDFRKFISRAIRTSPDPDDIEYIALALSEDTIIWTDDKDLKKQTKVKIISTTELIEKLKIISSKDLLLG